MTVPVALAVVSELLGRLVMSLRALDQGAAGAWPGAVGDGANCGAKRVFTYRAHSRCMFSSEPMLELNCAVGA